MGNDANLPTVKIIPKDRLVERTQGCWNCVHRVTGEKVEKIWSTHKAALMQQIRGSSLHTNGHVSADPMAMEEFQRLLKQGIDQATALDIVKRERAGRDPRFGIIDKAENDVRSGALGSCSVPGGPKDAQGQPIGTDFIHMKFLCSKWTGATGASVAREGQKADELPEELRDRIDGATPAAKKPVEEKTADRPVDDSE